MKRTTLPQFNNSPRVPGILVMLLALTVFPFLFTATAGAQGNQLSLADILIGLRSKKAPLTDRNKILSDAVVSRGTTFTLTPEIEKELSVTGASPQLIDSIRNRVQIAKASNVSISPSGKAKAGDRKVEPVAEPVEPTPDFSFYEKRAAEHVGKGDVDAAIIDYTKAIEMNSTAVASLMGRATVYLGKSLYQLALYDVNKVIELDARNAAAYALRGQVYDKKANAELALDDYKKAVELGTTDDTAKAAVAAWNNREKEAEAAKAAAANAIAAAPVAAPEFVEMGSIGDAHAVRMVKPAYSSTALQAGAGGQVVLDVELDTEGNVTKVKVVSGHQLLRLNSEDAARRSKFKPAMFNGQAVKGKGRITYNFVTKR